MRRGGVRGSPRYIEDRYSDEERVQRGGAITRNGESEVQYDVVVSNSGGQSSP